MRDQVVFFHAGKDKDSYKLVLSYLVGVARHVQSNFICHFFLNWCKRGY